MEAARPQNKQIDPLIVESIRKELNALEKELVEIEGNKLNASQCYRLELDPPHVLFNTNCPDQLKQKVESILARYLPANEDRSSQ